MSDELSQRVTLLPNGKDFILEITYLKGEVAGVKVLIAISVFSMIAVLSLLISIALSAWNTRKSINPHMFVRSHSCAYLVSMLICDFLQSIGSIMNAAWTQKMAVEFGTTCKAQGAIKHIADVGPAIWSLVIALNTFWILFLRQDSGKYVFISTLVGGWALIGVLVVGGPAVLNEAKNGSFFGISGNWCWISEGYPVARIVLDYMWMFISAGLTFIIYGMILLKLRGNLIQDGWKLKFKLHVKKPQLDSPDGADSQMIAIAKQMLLYPIAYTILILPIACCRFADWSGHSVSWGATVFSDSVFLLSGIVNVVLFMTTRRVLPPHSVITKRLSIPPVLQRTLSRTLSRDTLVGTASKTMSIDEASIDLEKATYINHDDASGPKAEEYTADYSSNHLTVAMPPVSPLRPESMMSVTATTTFQNLPPVQPGAPPNFPMPMPAPTPAHQRSFHDIPLDTPTTSIAVTHHQENEHGDDSSDYSSSPSTAGYPLSSPGSGRSLGHPTLNRLSSPSPLPNPHEHHDHYDSRRSVDSDRHSDDGHDHE